MSSNSTYRVLRRPRPLPSSYRRYPYATGNDSGKQDMRDEVVRLGVELSLAVSESMFLLCDDIHTMLWFCIMVLKRTIPYESPVSERLLRVIHHVYSKDIKPKNGVYLEGGKSVHSELMMTTWKDFTQGFIVLHRLVMLLRGTHCASFDDRLLVSAVAKYKQVLKELEDKLSPVRHVSEANGFARETVESNISGFWKNLFDQEADKASDIETMFRILDDLSQPIMDNFFLNPTSTGQPNLRALPVDSPYILGKDFAKQELKEEVVRLGVKLSLDVAESMFLLCDDIRSMLSFCYGVWSDGKRELNPGGPMMLSLLRVMHHVNSKYIRQKNGLSQDGGKSAQWELAKATLEDFCSGMKDLDFLVSILRSKRSCVDGREFTSRIEETLKKVGLRVLQWPMGLQGM